MSRNPRLKISERKKRNKNICELFAMGFTGKEISESYNLSIPQIATITRLGGVSNASETVDLVSYSKIAEELGMSIREVKSLLTSALCKMRIHIESKDLEYADLSLE